MDFSSKTPIEMILEVEQCLLNFCGLEPNNRAAYYRALQRLSMIREDLAAEVRPVLLASGADDELPF